MERRGRIPVAKFRTQDGKTRSRSRVREPDYNEQDPETDLFTLLEDNIALKEANKALQTEIEENKKIQSDLIQENKKLRNEVDLLKMHEKECNLQLKDLSAELTKSINEKNVIDKLHRMKIEQLNALSMQLKSPPPPIIDSNGLKNKILKIMPAFSSTSNSEMESLIDVLNPSTTLAISDYEESNHITNECVERLVDEFLTLKNTLGSVELQLYEANEKISELMENQHSVEEENESLRSENNNLTRVAQLLTDNMKESVETSKKMEEALIKLKERNDQLTMKTKDIIDGQQSPMSETMKSTEVEDLEDIRKEALNQNKDHGERIVEMKSLLDATIEKTTNDELKILQLKLGILEEELRQAIARAVRAENELEKLKCLQNSRENREIENVTARPSVFRPQSFSLPPPPPPPIPAVLLYSPFHNQMKVDPISGTTTKTTTAMEATFNESIMSQSLRKGSGSSSSSYCGKQQVEAATASASAFEPYPRPTTRTSITGLDALVRELKSGKVTLRRNRRKTRTSEALQEMFQVLEISQKQNRNSKFCIEINS